MSFYEDLVAAWVPARHKWLWIRPAGEELINSLGKQRRSRRTGDAAHETDLAATESAEFESIYKLKVTSVPTNRPKSRKDMAKASYHFVRGKSLEKFAATLVNFMAQSHVWIVQCYHGEDDLAIARGVLMYVSWYLSLGNMRDANYLVDEVKKLFDSKNEEFPESDLIQFIIYLLQTLDKDALPINCYGYQVTYKRTC